LVRKSVEKILDWTYGNGGAKTEIVKGGKLSVSYYRYTMGENPHEISVLGLSEDGKETIIKTIYVAKRNTGMVDNPLITETFSYSGDMQVSVST
jgi:hypothetical protein